MEYRRKEEFGELLRNRGAAKPCHRCGSEALTIMDRSEISLTDEPGHFRSFPTVLVGCENCGHLYHHSLGLLGLPLDYGEKP